MKDKLNITQVFAWRNCQSQGHKFIVLLLSVAFQLSVASSLPVMAGSRLPVFDKGLTSALDEGRVFKSWEAAGYQTRRVGQDDFLFSIDPATTPYVLVPLSDQLNQSALAVLGRYVAAGGHLLLLPAQVPLSPSAQRLLMLIGLTADGTAAVSEATPLFWQGAGLPTGDTLPAGAHVVTVQPGLGETVLATWGHQYPALITTRKGALLNWPWGQPLSRTTVAMALSKVMPNSVVFKTSPNAMPIPFSEQESAKGADLKASKSLPTLTETIQTAANASASLHPLTLSPPPSSPSGSATKSVPSQPASVSPPPQIALAVVETPERFLANLPAAVRDSLFPSSHSANQAHNQLAKQTEKALPKLAQAPANVSVSPTQKASPDKKSDTESSDADAEVLDNILGRPAEAPATGAPAAAEQKPGEQAQPQKPFSFLDPGADSVIAPEFDYGTYSYNLRVLDDYRRRINEATETAKQLSMTIPDEKIRKLLWDAHQHKRKFESLYLNGQTQAGLDAYAEARRLTLKALALTSDSPRVEGRAIWLDRGTIVGAQNPEELKKIMQKLHQAGINIVYFETLNAGFPIYPSAILKQNPLVQGWDPLKVGVEEGHRLGMEVHAWVWAFAVGNRRHNPLISKPVTYPGPILSDTGLMSEALRNSGGGLEVDNRQNEFWLDPASEKGRAFLLSAYQEIVSRYDVDGLQLDYIRYPFQTAGNRMGFDAVGRDRFYRATGQTLDNLDDYTAKLWIAWKTYQVSSFVQQVSNTLRSIKPAIKISAAVFPMRRESRIVSIQQDWETWIDNGWVDTLSPMSYTTDPDRLQGMFDYVQSSPQKRSLIYPGIALHRLDGGQLVQHLETLRHHGGLGATLFAGAHLDAEKIETLGSGPFKTPNSIPPHRDVVKSLQIIVDDYGQKFNTLQSKGALSTLTVPQGQALQASITALNANLVSLSPFKNPGHMPAASLAAAQQSLSALQAANDDWLQGEADNRFRAQYFNQKMQLLSQLLGYLLDKNNIASKAAKALPAEAVSQNAEKAPPAEPLTENRP